MYRIAVTGLVVALVAGSIVPGLNDLLVRPPVETAAAPADDGVGRPVSSGGPRLGDEVFLADAGGHFRLTARIAGTQIGMLADTGATLVALRAGDAARLGIHPSPADYDVPVSTANGTVKAARTVLSDVTVGRVRIERVQAVVIPDHALSVNLLGMSFLGRVGRFEIADGRLVLSP